MTSCDPAVSAAPTPVPGCATAGHLTTADGVRLRWLERGDPHAPAVVMLHGLRSYAATFAPLADALSKRWRCLAVDARGRGGSGWDPAANYHTERYVADLAELVAAWGLTRFALLGHSMGGSTGFVYAAKHPDQVTAMVIEDILPGSSLTGAGAERIRREVGNIPADFATRDDAAAYWCRLRPHASGEALESRLEHSVAPDPATGRWRWIADMAGIAAARLDPNRPPVDLWPAVRSLQCPTLVICGSESDFTPPEVMTDVTRANPRISATTLTGAGHYVHDDRPDDFARAVTDFLEAHR